MSDKYILDDQGEPIPEDDVLKWGKWFENREARRVARDIIGDSTVSTVFLGLDHGWGGGAPVLWETMVFEGPLNDQQDRCCGNRENAKKMHAAMVERVKASQVSPQ